MGWGGCAETRTVCQTVKLGKIQNKKQKKKNDLYNVKQVVQSTFQKMLITF